MKNLFRRFIVVFCLLSGVHPLHAQWVRTNGPVGCESYSIIVYGNDLLLNTAWDAIYRSPADAARWIPVFDTHSSDYGTAMAVVDSVLLAGYRTGVVRSVDGGVTWQPANDGLTHPWINDFAVGNGDVFAATYLGGMYRSTDRGAHWVAVNAGIPLGSIQVSTVAVRDSIVLAGTSNGGIYRSTNRGDSWKSVSEGYSIASFAFNDSTWFAGTKGNGTYRSDNDGVTWTLIDALPDMYSTYALAADGRTVYAATRNGAFRSDDNGRQWVRIDAGLPSGLAFTAFAIHGSTVYASVGGAGVYASTDKGATWNVFSHGLTNTLVIGLATAGSVVFAVNALNSGAMCSRSDDAGATWTILAPTAKIPVINSIASVGKRMFGAASNGVVEIVGDSAIATSMNIQPSRLKSIHDTLYVSTVQREFFRSSDTARTWTRCGKSTVEFSDFAGSGREIYVGTVEYGFLRSKDTGQTWQDVTAGLEHSMAQPAVIRSLILFGKGLYAIANGDLYFLETGAVQWKLMRTGMSGDPTSLFETGKVLIAATTDGLFTLQRDDTVWTHAASQTGKSPSISVMATDGNMLYAGTSWTGVWRRPLADVVTAVRSAVLEAPGNYRLDQNYPNPFNPTTTISFSLPSRSFVSMKIFDAMGKEVTTIVSKEMAAGNYLIQWDASSMASGMYFYQLHAGTYVETKRLLLIK